MGESVESVRRQKLINTFRHSKAKIKEWEKEFTLKNRGEKVSLLKAPKEIQVCYKNCKKIQYFLDKPDLVVQNPPSSSSSTWGSHLNVAANRKASKRQESSERLSSLILLDSQSLGPPKVRTSLKRKKRGASSSLIGNLHDEENTEEDKEDMKDEEGDNDVFTEIPSSASQLKVAPSSEKSTIALTRRIDGPNTTTITKPQDSEEEEETPQSKRPRLEQDPSPSTQEVQSSMKDKLLSKKNSWNENYRRINLKKKCFTRFNKGIARKREANANKSKFRSKGKSYQPSQSKKNLKLPPTSDMSSSIVIPEPLLPVVEIEATSKLRSMSDEDLDTMVHEALISFGHSEFRRGQKEAIFRILRGESTLVVLSTGSGKSLIYQIPAYLLAKEDSRLTIVVSPLVSLMEDQLRNMPTLIQADLFHSDLGRTQLVKIKDGLRENKLAILFMTPETLFSQLKTLKEFIPRLGFVCIDEAHCMSQWSHNFRPAYFQLGGAIRESLKATTILGLTATATEKTITTIAERLQVDSEGGIIKGTVLRKNLLMSVSKDFRRDEALIEMLNSEKFSALGSIIIYCTRREECERVAAIIRTRRRGENSSKNNIIASSFHAGLSHAKRKRIYNDFISGKLKIIVATIAFGMGINKSDIRGVVHYNMPSTLESYVQEIGRAGRDENESYCHLFMDAKGKDLNELKRHVFSNSVDRVIVRKFVGCIFNDKTFTRDKEEYRDVVLSTFKLIELLDMPEENITTLMCYLENHEKQWIRVGRQISDVVKIQIYGSTDKIRNSVPDHRILDYIILNKTSDTSYRVTEMAKELQVTCEHVWDALARLKYAGVTIDYGQPGFHLRVRNDVSENDLDDIQNLLCDKIFQREKNEINKLQRTFRTFLNVSHDTWRTCIESFDHGNCDKLNAYINDYFSEQAEETTQVSDSLSSSTVDEIPIRQQIRQFLSIYSDQSWTGRSIARVFHGIPSPNFPAQTWYRARGYWKAFMDIDFNAILRLATKEIVGMRTGLS
ncbi:ATP-dependent DNA helicase Q4 [Lepeophtheirus salmonis]|uniref:ATP-dependent DNA helicase Q4 n=1 Tax=Lepeophtheirus salmonis TaxID=72036 RepID=UPI001AEB9DB6|nr:ATP-dependent DNA helicase Q4-like [Lepeophtheirus salmonis]